MIRQSSRARRLGGSATARGPGPRGSRGWAAGLLAFGVLATAIAVPTCLGVLAVDVTVDLNLGDAGLGLVVSAFWAVTAVAAPVAGRWVDRVGWPAGVRVGALVTAACLASCALDRKSTRLNSSHVKI